MLTAEHRIPDAGIYRQPFLGKNDLQREEKKEKKNILSLKNDLGQKVWVLVRTASPRCQITLIFRAFPRPFDKLRERGRAIRCIFLLRLLKYYLSHPETQNFVSLGILPSYR